MQAHLSIRILWTVGIFFITLAIVTAAFTSYFLYRAIADVYASEVVGLVQGAEKEAQLLAAAKDAEALQHFLDDLIKIEWVDYAVYEDLSGSVVATEVGTGREVIDLLRESGIGIASAAPTEVNQSSMGPVVRRLSRDLATKGVAMVGVQILGHSLFDITQLEPTGSAELHIGVTQSAAVRNLAKQLGLQSLGICLLFAVAYLAVWRMIRRSARPLTVLAREVRHIEGAEIAASVGGKGRDELSLLAGTVRSVAMELQVATRKLDESATSVQVRSQALEYARVHIRAVTELSTDGFLLADREGVVIEVNSQLSRLLGLSGEGMVGVASKLSPAAALSPLLEEALENPHYRPSRPIELVNHRQGSGSSIALTSDSELPGGMAKVIGAVVRVTDLAQSILLEKRLLVALEEIWSRLAPHATELIEEARAGLELVVREWGPRLKSWPTEQQEAIRLLEDDLGQIVSHCAQLMRGVKSGMTLSSLRSYSMGWQADQFQVSQLIHRLSAEVERQFPNHDVRFFSRIEEGLPDIKGDQDRLIDLLIGLITHSYSITEHGSVVCSAGWRGGAIALGVQDTGEQLRPEERLFLFDPIEYDEVSVGLILAHEVSHHYGTTIAAKSHGAHGNDYEFLMRLE
jgi:PAS domain-containing protein